MASLAWGRRIGAKCGWVKRVGLTSRLSLPLYPEHRTFPDAVGTSHLCQSRHFAVQEDSEPFRAGPHEGLHRLADRDVIPF